MSLIFSSEDLSFIFVINMVYYSLIVTAAYLCVYVCVSKHICPLLSSCRPDVCKGKEET